MLIPRERKARRGPLDQELTTSSDHQNLTGKYNLADTSPDVQVQKRGYRYFEEMELRDTHWRGLMWTRKSQALHLGWDITPASDDNIDQQRAACAKAGLMMAQGAFKNDLRDLLDAVPKGYKLCEKVYGLIPSGDFAGKIGFTRIKALPQWDYGPESDEKRRLISVQSRVMLQSAPHPLDKFVLHIHDQQNEDPLGRGIASPASWWYWFKHEGAKWWAISGERYAMPFAKITMPRNPGTKDRQQAEDLVKKIKGDTGVTLPHGFALELVSISQQGISTYDGLIAQANAEMTFLALGATLSVQEGRRSGSLAQAREHGKMPSLYAGEDADNLEETVQEQIVKDADDKNFGLGEPYPTFKIIRDKTEISRDRALNIQRAQRAGLRIPERWAYEEFDIPVPADDEDVLEPLMSAGGSAAGEGGGGSEAFAEDPAITAAGDEVDALITRAERLAHKRYDEAFADLKKRLGKKKHSRS